MRKAANQTQMDAKGNALSRKQTLATTIGVVAILLWATLALLAQNTAGLPPLQVLALSFAVAAGASLVLQSAQHVLRPPTDPMQAFWRQWRQPLGMWGLSFAGLFFYHALYFFAVKNAPVAHASLIAYLWPLFIVLLAAGLTPEGLQRRQLWGALLGLMGSAWIILQGADKTAALAAYSPWTLALGYAAAFGCALVWSSYSVCNRRYRATPSSVMGAVCALVAIAAGISHLCLETTVTLTATQAWAILALGIGPFWLGFVAWDFATKHGHLPSLGALSYLAPLLSTVLLIAFGSEAASLWLLLPALLIIGGALLATVQKK